MGVVAEAIDDAARRFYPHHELAAVPEHARKLFIAMRTIATLFAWKHSAPARPACARLRKPLV